VELRSLWNEKGANWTRKDEAALSNTVVAWMRQDLGKSSGLVLNREVIIDPLPDRLDIKIEAAAPNRPSIDPLTVVVEVKGSWNRDLLTSMGKQLVARYLAPKGWQHGVYLVGWFPKGRKVEWNGRRAFLSKAQAENELSELVKRQSPEGFTVTPILLDCSPLPRRR
jgi:hypothetical protein